MAAQATAGSWDRVSPPRCAYLNDILALLNGSAGIRATVLSVLLDREGLVRTWSKPQGREAAPLLPRGLASTFEILLDAVGNVVRGQVANIVEEAARVGASLQARGVPFHDVVESATQLCVALRACCSRTSSIEQMDAAARIFEELIAIYVLQLSDGYLAPGSNRAHHSAGSHSPLLVNPALGYQGLVGGSTRMISVIQGLSRISESPGAALIAGESGTGKEIAARAIHTCGKHADAPFVAVNCATLSHAMIESELFGHRKGAFTGAQYDHPGLMRAAREGTFFLDEITEMPPEIQGKLLRVLQERRIRPVGAIAEIPFEARVIASTNRDPRIALRDGVLREDLYYRLAVHELWLPPLRDRLEDIPLLIDHFLRLDSVAREKGILGVSPLGVFRALGYPWPGNVRELANVVARAAAIAEGEWLDEGDLAISMPSRASVMNGAPTVYFKPVAPEKETGPGLLSESEREHVIQALHSSAGNKSKAARMLGISRKRLYGMMRRLRIGM